MLSVFLALAIGVPDQVIDVHETVPLPLFVRVVPGVRPSVGSLDLVDALDRAFRSATMLRVVEVGQECGSELGCMAKQAAAGTARFGIAVFSGSRGNDVTFVDLVVLRDLVAGGSQDLLTDILRKAVLESAALGTFNHVEEIDQDASAFLQATKPRLSDAGLWGRPASARVRFSGAQAKWLHVNDATVAVGADAEEVLVTGLWPKQARLSAGTSWATQTQEAALEAGTEQSLTFELPRGPGVTTRRWLVGGGAAVVLAGAAVLIGVGIANASAKPVPCFQKIGGQNESCTGLDAAVPLGAGVLGLGVGGIGAALVPREEADSGVGLLDGLLFILGAAVGITAGSVFEAVQ